MRTKGLTASSLPVTKLRRAAARAFKSRSLSYWNGMSKTKIMGEFDKHGKGNPLDYLAER